MVRVEVGKNSVKYSSRGFAQDAQNAMKGNVVRGLVELITNSDDAYESGADGKIAIEVERHRGSPSVVVVKDRARGMSKATLLTAIGQIGGRTSGFEAGREVRGNLGRGAKDLAAFGKVTFESICDGRYSNLVLEPDGTFDDPVDRKATTEDRDELGVLRGNGTRVTVQVAPRFRFPLQQNLIEQLQNHFQLRDILSDPKRDVTITDSGSDDRESLRYSRPVTTELVTTDVEIEGYPGVTASVIIHRLPERGDKSSTDPCRSEGLLIKGRKAIYDNTLFSAENSPTAHWFTGSVRCAAIDDLARSYDDASETGEGHTDSNPLPIISRSRDGLEQGHPFARSLEAAVMTLLGPLIEEEEKKAAERGTVENARLRRDLDALGRDLGQLIDDDLKEMDEEGIGGTSGGDEDRSILVIPASPVLYMNEDKTLSILVKKSLGNSNVTIELDPEGVVEWLDTEIRLDDHPRKEAYWIGRIRLRPLIENEETSMRVIYADDDVDVLIQVRPEREDPDPEPPTTLEFEREVYHVSEGKRRKLRLRAPLDLVNEVGTVSVRVTSSGSGVVVLGGPVDLTFDEVQLCFVGAVVIEPRELGSVTTLTAVLETAVDECRVVVGKFEGDAPNVRIRIDPEEQGYFRANVKNEGGTTVFHILGGHKAIRRYLGPAPEYPLQDSPQARAVIAEIIAGEAARFVLERKFKTAGELDGPAFYSEHLDYMARYLPRCHQSLSVSSASD